MERLNIPGEIYLTFKYDGIDSSEKGVYVTSSGGRYSINTAPSFNDFITEAPGYDGNYYYGTQLNNQTFVFNCFAHDLSLSEFDDLKVWLNPRSNGKLVLPDQPYKYYNVKPETITSLSAFAKTGYYNYNNENGILIGEDEVIYTGDFSVTFKTIGSSYGKGFSYYRDNNYYNINYSNSGLLYKDETPILTYNINSNTNGLLLKLYNPGTATTKPKLTINLGSSVLPNNSYIKIENKDLNTISIIDVSGLSGIIVVDFEKQTITNSTNFVYYNKIIGQPFGISPKKKPIELPKSFVKTIENAETEIKYITHIEGNVVYLDKDYIKVKSSMVGKYFCINNNGGAKILSINATNNTLTLDATIRGGIGTYDITIANNGFPCNYIECNNVLPGSGSVGDVVVVNDIWYMYLYNQWFQVDYFSSKNDFYDENDLYETKYIHFNCAILELDEIEISTGNAVSFSKNGIIVSGSSMGAIALTTEIQPYYL